MIIIAVKDVYWGSTIGPTSHAYIINLEKTYSSQSRLSYVTVTDNPKVLVTSKNSKGLFLSQFTNLSQISLGLFSVL
jgi:hypothetical protein